VKDAVTDGETEAVLVTDAVTDRDIVTEGDIVPLPVTLLVGEGDRLPVFVEDADGLVDAVSEEDGLADAVSDEDADRDADTDEDSVIVGVTVDESSVHPCRPPQYWQPSPAVPGSVKMSM
jgi:hypothetical protein